MEQSLDKIAAGELKRDELLINFHAKFSEDIEKFEDTRTRRQTVPTDIECPQCKEKKLCVRFSKNGEFLGCSGYPECNFTANFTKHEDGMITIMKPEKPTDSATRLKCPNCDKNLVHKMGKFGPFIACPGYPECKYIHQEVMKTPCPKCKGEVAKRFWRGGEFWGCKNYPKCKFAIFSKIIENPCPKCNKYPYQLVSHNKDGDEIRRCPDKKGCGYSRTFKVHKEEL